MQDRPSNTELETKDEKAEEVFPDFLPDVIKVLTSTYVVDTDFTNKRCKSEPPQFTLFGTPYLSLLHTEATELGNMIFWGEEKDVEIILAKVRENPALLDLKVTVMDQHKTPVIQKTLMEIAAMAGDVNLRPKIVNEKDRGLFERLKEAGNVSTEKAAESKQCINSAEAKIENEKRVERYLEIIKKFGMNLCEGKLTLKKAIAQLEEDLQLERSKAVNLGLIFDPIILQKAAEWFEDNVYKLFGCWQTIMCDAFWIYGIGKLQSLLSSRDAQALRAGLGMLQNRIPDRRLNNPDGRSYFYNEDSGLGRTHYLGYYCCEDARRAPAGEVGRSGARILKTYIDEKQQSDGPCATPGPTLTR